MWTVPGREVAPERLPRLAPAEVLYDFDGPRTFTLTDADGELFLAHWCDENEHFARFVVVPFSLSLVDRLKKGQIALLEALDQPRSWVADVEPDGNVHRLWRVDLTDLPTGVLPKPGTLLFASLEARLGQGAAV